MADADYDYSDYYQILNELLLSEDFGDTSKKSGQNKIIKRFRTVNLCQNIIFSWARSEDNLRPAIFCSERTILNAWEVLRKNELYSNKQVTQAFWDMYLTLFQVYDRYLDKVHPYCRVKNGFSGASHSYLLECLGIFENLGIVSLAGLIFVYQSLVEGSDDIKQGALSVGQMLKEFIDNHPSTHSPCYDGHIIDMSVAIYLLCCLGEKEFVDGWIQNTIQSVAFSYHQMGKYFPIDNDSFEDLVGFTEGETVEWSSLFKMSTLIPILAQWR
ncbi:hypothetical protein [Microbulbifer halophilus]|uniref:hypothetical protein n=1 Tax=Microbulbifer halophilus TaxID=453963 RepID=UPI003611C9B1